MINDLKYALRMLAKAPAFTAIVVLTLALGIGANTAIFSVVHAVLLRPLPITEPDQIVQLYESKDHPAGFTGSVSAANLRDWREQNNVFTGIAAYGFQNFALQGKDSPERLIGVRASANYFSVMGARPLLGRDVCRRRRSGRPQRCCRDQRAGLARAICGRSGDRRPHDHAR